MPNESKAVDFDRTFLPHMDAAYNLARWLVHDDHDAQDVVQKAYLRPVRFAAGFRAGDRRARIHAIVRNTAYTWLERNRGSDSPTEFDEKAHGIDSEESGLEAEAISKPASRERSGRQSCAIVGGVASDGRRLDRSGHGQAVVQWQAGFSRPR